MHNQKFKVLLNDVKYLNRKCIVFYDSYLHNNYENYTTVFDFLKSDILEKYVVFAVGVQQSLFDDGEDIVTIYLK